ncbi:P-loop containing dynein motor region D4-domain-containing protein, partial [Baffinella frigidus]
SSPTERDLPVVQTADLRKASDLFSLWLDSAEPFLLVGPEGCGKSMLLRNAFQQRKNYEVATINCNAQTSAIHVIQKLQQSCTVATAQSGRVFRPKAERLILYLKDVNLPKPDKYGTMQLIAFLQQLVLYQVMPQLVLYQGFYDNLEWMGIEKVQIVCSMNPSTTVGRHQLTTRFTAILRIASITYPARETLQQVYSAYLSAVLCSRLPKHPDWGPRKTADKLASTLLDFFEGLKERFSVDDFRHYLFTPRDITTLVVGLLRYDVNEVHPLDALSYEAGRIFRDRLVGENAAREFDGQVWGNLIRSQWGHKVDLKDASFTTWLFETDGELGDGGAKMVGRASSEDLKNRITDGLIQYEREFKELGMLLFPEIVARIARLDRVLSAPGGSALLIGRPGVGRRTCVTLACYMHDIEIVTPKMGRDYGAKQFLNDIKGAVTTAGAGGLPMALYLEDFQLVDAAFLEIVNSLLSSGEAPGMFTAQELEGLMGPLKEEYSSQGYYKFRNIYAFFVSRVQKNLHIIISLDPQHPDFLLRCESNPALYTQCTIMWLEAWSGVGMAAVPKMHLKDILADIPEPDQLVEDMQFVHETMVQRGAAPRQYVTLINTMTSLYHGKRSALTKQTQFLQGGLTKLAETAVTVKNLSGEAVQQAVHVQETVLRAKQKEAKEKMVEITANVTDAGRKKAEAEDLSKKLVAAQSTMEVKKRQVKGELAECEPVLEEARAAVGNIKKDNLNEIRSLKLPPEPIRDVLEGVLRLMNNQDTSWISMKKFLSQTSVIQDILTFDAKVVTPEIREAVRKLMTNKAASFQAENIQRVSQAAAPMAAWVKAQMQYSLVLEKIRPLTSELEKLDTSLESAMKRKRECEKDIQQSDEAVKTLSDEYETLLGDASNLNSGLEKVKTTLFAAEDLLGKLNEENDRAPAPVGPELVTKPVDLLGKLNEENDRTRD